MQTDVDVNSQSATSQPVFTPQRHFMTETKLAAVPIIQLLTIQREELATSELARMNCFKCDWQESSLLTSMFLFKALPLTNLFDVLSGFKNINFPSIPRSLCGCVAVMWKRTCVLLLRKEPFSCRLRHCGLL